MAATFVSMTLALALAATGQGGRIMPPGPGYGWGFPNGNPDGYGWWDNDAALPLGADRTSEYFFPRYFVSPAPSMFMPTYYNPYVSRGQRFIPYTGCGGAHPAGGPPPAPADLPLHPYNETIGSGPRVQIPAFSGHVDAPPINSGGTGLTP